MAIKGSTQLLSNRQYRHEPCPQPKYNVVRGLLNQDEQVADVFTTVQFDQYWSVSLTPSFNENGVEESIYGIIKLFR